MAWMETGQPAAQPTGGGIRPGLYHVKGEVAYGQPVRGPGGMLSNSIRIDGGTLYENRSVGLLRRYRWVTQGTNLLLEQECERDEPQSGSRTYGYTADSTTLVLFKKQSIVTTFTRVGD